MTVDAAPASRKAASDRFGSPFLEKLASRTDGDEALGNVVRDRGGPFTSKDWGQPTNS